MKDLEKKVEEITDELQRKEKEHADMVDTLSKQREELMNQINQLNEIKKTVVMMVEELGSADKMLKDDDKTSSPGDIKLKEIILKYKQDLNNTVMLLDQVVLSTEKLSADNVIVRTAEKKKTAEIYVD